MVAAVVIKTDADFATENNLEPANAGGNAGLPGDQTAVDGLHGHFFQRWLGGEAQNWCEHDDVARYQPERRAETNVDRAAAGNRGDTAGVFVFADAELGEDQTVARFIEYAFESHPDAEIGFDASDGAHVILRGGKAA